MTYSNMVKGFLLSVLFFASFNAQAARGRVSLKKAMFSRLISVKATSLGGYLGNRNIKLALTNNTDKELTVDIDPALIFKPQDSTYQDLVLMGNETIALAPCERKDVSLQGFCGKSYAHAPIPDLKYEFKKQGDSNLIKTLIYAHNNNIGVGLIQDAVWTFTNNYRLNTIYDHANMRVSEDFVKYIAGLKKVSVPEFFMENKLEHSANQPVVKPNNEKIYVTMHWGNEGYQHMYLYVYKENGEVYKKIEADQVIDKYGYTVIVQFDPRVDPKGVYTVQLHDEYNKVFSQKRVVVGLSPFEGSGSL